MKNNRILVIVICVITIIIHCFIAYIHLSPHSHNLSVDYVITESDAIEIGKIICQNTYPQFDYNSLTWECLKIDDTWIVFCRKTSAGNNLGGGLPEVHLTSSGEIVSLGLSK